jgi:hypothetical protein
MGSLLIILIIYLVPGNPRRNNRQMIRDIEREGLPEDKNPQQPVVRPFVLPGTDLSVSDQSDTQSMPLIKRLRLIRKYDIIKTYSLSGSPTIIKGGIYHVSYKGFLSLQYLRQSGRAYLQRRR